MRASSRSRRRSVAGDSKGALVADRSPETDEPDQSRDVTIEVLGFIVSQIPAGHVEFESGGQRWPDAFLDGRPVRGPLPGSLILRSLGQPAAIEPETVDTKTIACRRRAFRNQFVRHVISFARRAFIEPVALDGIRRAAIEFPAQPFPRWIAQRNQAEDKKQFVRMGEVGLKSTDPKSGVKWTP